MRSTTPVLTLVTAGYFYFSLVALLLFCRSTSLLSLCFSSVDLFHLCHCFLLLSHTLLLLCRSLILLIVSVCTKPQTSHNQPLTPDQPSTTSNHTRTINVMETDLDLALLTRITCQCINSFDQFFLLHKTNYDTKFVL